MIYELKSDQQFKDLLQSEKLVLVDFYADWCEPCKWLDIILNEVDTGFSGPLCILKIDSEKYADLVKEYEIRSVPVLLFFMNNALIWRMNGFLDTGDLIEKLTVISRGTPDF